MDLLDKFDYAILAVLQADATLSIASLSDIVGLSSTPCWKRVKRLAKESETDRHRVAPDGRVVGVFDGAD